MVTCDLVLDLQALVTHLIYDVAVNTWHIHFVLTAWTLRRWQVHLCLLVFKRTAWHDYFFLRLVLLIDLPQWGHSWIVWVKLLASSYDQSLLLELLLPILDYWQNSVLCGTIRIIFSLIVDLWQLYLLFKVAYIVFVSPVKICNVSAVLQVRTWGYVCLAASVVVARCNTSTSIVSTVTIPGVLELTAICNLIALTNTPVRLNIWVLVVLIRQLILLASVN